MDQNETFNNQIGVLKKKLSIFCKDMAPSDTWFNHCNAFVFFKSHMISSAEKNKTSWENTAI